MNNALFRLFFAFALLGSPLAVAQDSKGESAIDVVAACKKDCPKAATNEEAHKCAEKLGRLNKEFRKSSCWDVNEKYEKQVQSAK